ncbi:tetratricopeptide repeat protein 21B-like [Leucoraja erinacea]|uniref:tetratricopeptide repeat protein 21B-like n=1 Tax=Leucoraja erinaceus TaxID=7782 RepID=UPI00245762A6|nr:tetratricopeptide repeat protein 21B-like [Leucoraja erinacea]
MSAKESITLASITYYYQENYFNHLLNVAVEGLEVCRDDPVLLFFKAFGDLMEGRIQEAIRDLEAIRDKQTVELCSIIALIHAHRKSSVIDQDAIHELEAGLKDCLETAGEKSLYYASMTLWFTDRLEEAREYSSRLMKISNGSKEALILKGWIELAGKSSKIGNLKKAIGYLEGGLQNSKDIFGLMGKVYYLLKKQNFLVALETVNQIIATNPTFLPALVLKMKLFLAQNNWDQTLETAKRQVLYMFILFHNPYVLIICWLTAYGSMHLQPPPEDLFQNHQPRQNAIMLKDETNVDALLFLCLHAMCKLGEKSEAETRVMQLIKALEIKEPQNPKLYNRVAVILSRMCGRNQTILEQMHNLVEHALHLDPTNSQIAAELGFQLILQEKPWLAAKQYTEAMKLDESNIPALTGRIRAEILLGHLEDAEQQLEFLKEVQEFIGTSGELAYLQAILAANKGRGPKVIVKFLNQAVDIHFTSLQDFPLSVEYFEKLNPEFLLDIVKKLLSLCPDQSVLQGQPLSPLLRQSAMILEPVFKVAPGIKQVLYIMAQIRYLSGNLNTAQAILHPYLQVNPTFADGHLLMSQIYLSQGNYKECSHSLELGLSYNFQVRDHPTYHLIKARALKRMGNIGEAVTVLKTAIGLPGVRNYSNVKGKESLADISISNCVSVYLELAVALQLNGEQHEAFKVMQDAIREFAGTTEEPRITVANVDLSLSRDDVETAFSMLRSIHPKQPYYIKAQEKLAEIYLHKKKDRRLYIKCYKDLSEQFPNPQITLLLGDAYITVQEPEKAIEVYEQILKKNPHDGQLVRKIGQALVKTHHYTKAIHYFEAALKIGGQDFLCHDFAELLLKLRLFERAKKVLRRALEHDYVSDLGAMVNDVKYLMLLSRIFTRTHEIEEAVKTLNKAYELQGRLLKRLVVEQSDAITVQSQLASTICAQIAQLSVDQQDYDKAIRYYTEGLTFVENDPKLLIELAQLYLAKGDSDACEYQCIKLLKNIENNNDVYMMMADLMFKKQEYGQALFYYRQLLQGSPDNFLVLSKLITLFRKTGKLEKVPEVVMLAERKSPKTVMEPGFNYCRGLYFWYTGQPNAALRHFNKARKDSDWGQNAVYNMIQICLNPDSEIIGGNVFETLDDDFSGEPNENEMDQLAVRTAEKLLKEYHAHTQQEQEQRTLLQNSCLMATNDRSNVEKALEAFTEMAAAKKDHVPSLLAVAQACMVLKLIPRARNQLKRITKIPWNLKDAEEFEKSWLLLSDIYIKAGKYDLAMDLLKHCLQYNQSCCKAYEYTGFIMEKEQSYMDAVANYQMAWKCSSEANPAIGYKLAFNYLKAKMYMHAIDICHKVLRNHPTYPKIRKEVFEKARASFKP